MNAEQRFDEFDRVVADGRNLLAGFQAARDQVIGEAIGVALEFGEGHAPRAVGERRSDRESAPPRVSGDRRSPPGRCGPGPARRRWLRDWSCALPPSFVIPGASEGEPGISRFRGSIAALRRRNDGLMPDPENLPRFGRARDLAAGAARAGRDALDQLAVRGHLGAVAEIERIFQPGAQMAAEIGAALMQRPDFRAPDRGDLPVRFRQLSASTGSAAIPDRPACRRRRPSRNYIPAARNTCRSAGTCRRSARCRRRNIRIREWCRPAFITSR